MKVRLEKLDIHKGVAVKVLLNSGATGMFVDEKLTEEQYHKLLFSTKSFSLFFFFSILFIAWKSICHTM